MSLRKYGYHRDNLELLQINFSLTVNTQYVTIGIYDEVALNL